MSKVLKTTQIAVRFLEKMINAKLNVDGMEYLELSKHHPTVFVVNHFTRAETFILPYIIFKYTDVVPRSLADKELFVGKFGSFLSAMRALSVGDPHRDEIIIGDLMTGRNDWVIFPEGMMVKNKNTFNKGKYGISMGDTFRNIKTGSSVLALKAAFFRKQYFSALKKNELDKVKELEDRFGFKGETEITENDIAIVPVNITYYPIRPGANMIHSVAKRFFPDMSSRFEEEIEIEGNLLLKDTDIHIQFNRPFYPADYLFDENKIFKTFLKIFGDDRKKNFTLWYQKHRLTNGFMKVIYESLTINIDHIFCSFLRNITVSQIKKEEFFYRLYAIILELRKIDKKLHPMLKKEDMIDIISMGEFKPLQSILQLALQENILEESDDFFILHQDKIQDKHEFHTIRLENTMRVIANELEPLRDVIKIIEKFANENYLWIKSELAKLVVADDLQIFEKDYEKFYDPNWSREKSIGEPFLLEGSKNGLVLCHGYLSAPAEVRELAEYLHQKLNLTIYVVRLRGHGTAPKNLASVKWLNWYYSYMRGAVIIKCLSDQMMLGGFSSGGAMSLIHAVKGYQHLGVFCINAPLKLKDLKAKLIPAVSLWNDLLNVFKIENGKKEYVDNNSESPDINYMRNYLKGVLQLEKMMEKTNESLPKIKCPTLIIQSENDPTVNPISAQIIHDKILSEDKSIIKLPFDRHVIVRKEGKELVFEKIEDFLKKLFS